MRIFWHDEPALLAELEHVGSLIRSSVERSHSYVRTLLHSHLRTNGKMLRPALVLIGANLGAQEKREEAWRIASVLEMIHMASLIHDDVLDNAPLRRGLPTLHSQVGIKQAVLAGDYLLSKAMALIGEQTGDLKASAVSNACSRLCESELAQDAGQGDYSISVTTYLKRIAGKTASLFALSAYAGAAVVQAPLTEQYSMHRIGYLMGMAFQIEDDILDYSGQAKQLGKSPKLDLQNGIPTLPLLEALAHPLEGERLRSLVSKKHLRSKHIDAIAQKVVELGGVERSKDLAAMYVKRAEKEIKSLQHEKTQALLFTMVRDLTNRNS